MFSCSQASNADFKVPDTRDRLQRDALDTLAGVGPESEPTAAKTLTQCVDEYLTKKRSPSLELSYAAIHQYEQALTMFLIVTKAKYVSDVTEQDITRFADLLKGKGYSRKSIAMRYTIIRGFLTAHGVVLDKLMAASTPYLG